jgi:hypothetical protein
LARQFGVEGIHWLVASPHLSKLNRLTLHSHGIGAAGAKVIADSPAFHDLTHLTLDDPAFNRLGHKSHERVATAMAGLHELRLGDTVIGGYALRQLRATAGRLGGPDR